MHRPGHCTAYTFFRNGNTMWCIAIKCDFTLNNFRTRNNIFKERFLRTTNNSRRPHSMTSVCRTAEPVLPSCGTLRYLALELPSTFLQWGHVTPPSRMHFHTSVRILSMCIEKHPLPDHWLLKLRQTFTLLWIIAWLHANLYEAGRRWLVLPLRFSRTLW